VTCKDAWIKSESQPCGRCHTLLFKQSALAKCKLGIWYCSDKCAFNLQLNGGGWSTTATAPPKRDEQSLWEDEEELDVEEFEL
jgi:ribosomal protein L37AE/L43A